MKTVHRFGSFMPHENTRKSIEVNVKTLNWRFEQVNFLDEA